MPAYITQLASACSLQGAGSAANLAACETGVGWQLRRATLWLHVPYYLPDVSRSVETPCLIIMT